MSETDSAMSSMRRRLMAVLAHPDDESLGVGGTLAKYASDGVDVFLLTATRGDGGRFRGHRQRGSRASRLGMALGEHPRGGAAGRRGRAGGARCVAARLSRPAARSRRSAGGGRGASSTHLRRFRPDVVVTFGPDGAYGHPDHIAISQFTTAAIVAAADASFVAGDDGPAMHTAFGVEALLPRLAGRRPGMRTRRRSGRCRRRSTASSGTRRHGRTGPSRP